MIESITATTIIIVIVSNRFFTFSLFLQVSWDGRCYIQGDDIHTYLVVNLKWFVISIVESIRRRSIVIIIANLFLLWMKALSRIISRNRWVFGNSCNKTSVVAGLLLQNILTALPIRGGIHWRGLQFLRVIIIPALWWFSCFQDYLTAVIVNFSTLHMHSFSAAVIFQSLLRTTSTSTVRSAITLASQFISTCWSPCGLTIR